MTLDLQAIARRNYEAALAALQADGEQYPRWFHRGLHDLIGPLVPGRTIVVSARPGGGKTTLLLRQAQYMAEQGHRVVYLGTESPGSELQLRLSAWSLGLNPDYVIESRWHLLPEGAEEAIRQALVRWRDDLGHRLVFASADDGVTTAGDIGDAILDGAKMGFDAVVVDHLHEVAWSEGDRTTVMGDGIRALKDGAKAHRISLLLAAQRHRDPNAPAIEDYLMPTQSSIKQSGAIEEVSSFVLMPYRALKPHATPGDIEAVRKQQKELSEIAEPNVMKLHIAKARYRGAARDKHVKLYLDCHGCPHEFPEEAARVSFTPPPLLRQGEL